jgi:hypothetical protein
VVLCDRAPLPRATRLTRPVQQEAERALLRNPVGCERFRAVEVALRAPLGFLSEFRAGAAQRQPDSAQV